MVLKNELTVVIPTKTSPMVHEVVKEVKALPIEVEVLVVGYQISDGLKQAIVDNGGVFLDEPRKGKGVAVRRALAETDTKYVVMLDADGTYSASEIPVFLYALRMGADAIVGHRRWRKRGSMTLTHRIGNFGLSLLASILYGHRVKDICSGMWGFNIDAVKKFDLVSRGLTLEADLFSNTCRNNCRLAQVPIRYAPRRGGKAKATVWSGFKIAWFLIRRRFTR